MATYLTDDALCLRVTDFSETSQIVALFTRTHGLLPLIAKGAKRTSKKNTMSGPLDLLTSGEVVFVPAKGSAELGTLAAWELIDHRNALRADLPALNAAMMAAEVTTMLVHPHDPHEQLFHELEAMLDLLPTPQRPRALVAYLKATLDAAGYAPQFDVCLGCGKGITADIPLRFSPRAGGITCAACPPPPNSGGGAASVATTGRIAIALARLPAPTALRASPPERPADPAALLAASQLLLAHVESLTDKAVKTRYLLQSIFNVRPGAPAPKP